MNIPGIFLVGAERSGTTMLRLMLDHHPQIAWLNEFEYAIDLVSDEGVFPDVKEYIRWLGQNRIFNATGFHADSQFSYTELVHSFLAQRQQKASKPVIGATVHRHFDRLLTMFPDAKFIHFVRDPRDVAPSVIKMGWAGNTYTGCSRWLEAEECWEMVATRVPAGRRVDIRYEDLLKDPEGELTRACGLLAVPYDKQMLDFHLSTTYSAPDPSASQRWKKTLSKKDIGLVESRCSKRMESLGYACVSEAATHPSGFAKTMLFVQDKFSRTRSRIKMYGFGLWIKGIVYKRFSPNKRYPLVVARMNEIMQGLIK